MYHVQDHHVLELLLRNIILGPAHAGGKGGARQAGGRGIHSIRAFAAQHTLVFIGSRIAFVQC